MIQVLNGVKETVTFREDSTIKLYINDEAEDYPDHWHTPMEIIMPLDNHYNVVCNNNKFHIREGDILFIAPGTLHCLHAPTTGKRIILQAELSAFRFIREFETSLALMKPVMMITPEDAPLIHSNIVQIIHKIADEYFSNAQMVDVSIFSMLFEILVIVNRCYTNNTYNISNIKNNRQRQYIERFYNVCDYINQNFTENLTLEQVAKIAGFSKYHFSRLFKEFTNISFYKYLNLRRISYAEMLLIDPDMNITDIAYKSGFNNISSFIRMFKIIKSCTPTEFRQKYSF